MPEEGAGNLAIFLGEQVAGSMISQLGMDYIGDPLFNAIGISTSDSSDDYSAKVISAMNQLGNRLSREISSVQTAVANVAALTLQIDDYLQVEGLADVLRNFNEQANTIETLFTEFQDDIAFLSATDATKNKNALADLYTRLTSPNDTSVATAIANIHDLVVPPTAGDKGIFDYVAGVIGQKVLDGASTAMSTPAANTATDWTTAFTLPDDMQYYPAEQLYPAASATVSTEMTTVVSVMTRVLSAQVKGLVFLTRAWTGGPQESSLTTYTNLILDEINTMQNFWTTCKAAVTTSLMTSLQQNGKGLTGSITQLPWLDLRTLHNEGLWMDVPEGLDSSWIVWSTYSDSWNGGIAGAMMVRTPWAAGPPTALAIYSTGFEGENASYISSQSTTDWVNNGANPMSQPENTPGFTDAAPAALTALIGSLPATPAALQAAAQAARTASQTRITASLKSR